MTENEAFQDKLKFGMSGEMEIKEYLQNKHKAFLIPFYQFADANKAPLGHYLENNKIVLPDLFVVMPNKNGKFVPFFVECKRKKQWVHFAGKTETGIDRYHFDHYLRIRSATKMNVFIFFLHDGELPNGLFSVMLRENMNSYKNTDLELEKLYPTPRFDGKIPRTDSNNKTLLDSEGKKLWNRMVFWDFGQLRMQENF
jgi:hypothetical protein